MDVKWEEVVLKRNSGSDEDGFCQSQAKEAGDGFSRKKNGAAERDLLQSGRRLLRVPTTTISQLAPCHPAPAEA